MPTKQDKTCACGAPRTNGAKCRECYNTYMRDYMNKYNKTDKRRNQYLKGKYGITLEQYNLMLSEQNGQCALCGTNQPGQSKWFEVDHDHACCDRKGSCGECVRGLLCTNCNTGISRFRDNPDLMTKAALYVRTRSLVHT